MAESQALTVKAKAETVKSFISANLGQIRDALPKIGLTPESLSRAAFTQILKNPQLLDCDKRSLMKAIIEAAQLGLSFNLGRAYLVPYRNTKANRTDVQLIPGYLGLLDIARRSGEIASVSARAVYEGDAFTFRFGLEKDELNHDPLSEPDAAKLTHAYAIVRFRQGGYQVVVMTRKQIDAVRKRSKASTSGPWVTDYEAMALKTVLKRVLKLCPASVEMVKAIDLDGAREDGLPQHLATDMMPEEDGDFIDIEPEPEEPKQSKTATVKDALRFAKKGIGSGNTATEEIDRQDALVKINAAAVAIFKSQAEADVEVSAALGGRIQSVASLDEHATTDDLKAVLTHFSGIADAQ